MSKENNLSKKYILKTSKINKKPSSASPSLYSLKKELKY